MMQWPPKLTIVRRGGAIWIKGIYNEEDTKTIPGPYRGNEEEAIANARCDIGIIYHYYETTRAAHMAHALEFETLPDEADEWAVAARGGKPAPARGTPGWDKMYNAFITQLFNV